jgi:hypothetical protein
VAWLWLADGIGRVLAVAGRALAVAWPAMAWLCLVMAGCGLVVAGRRLLLFRQCRQSGVAMVLGPKELSGACCGAAEVLRDMPSLFWWRCCGGDGELATSMTTSTRQPWCIRAEVFTSDGGHDCGAYGASISLPGASW